MFDLDDCVGFITNAAAKQLSDIFNERLSVYGTTRVQWIALYYIGKFQDISQIELADKMNIKTSTMVRLIDRMERDDLVSRVKNKTDRRVTKLQLTEKGKKFREDLLPMGESFSNDATKNIPQQDLDTFKKVLSLMIENIK